MTTLPIETADTGSQTIINTELPYGETIDIFHRGAFHLIQPALKGHRSGVDAMILAATVPTDFKGSIADLGAGAGAAGLAVAARCPNTKVTLLERSPQMLLYAQKTLDMPENAALAARITLLEADVSAGGKARAEAGLADNQFDFAIMNPPFNSSADRQTPHELKAEAHVMQDGMFESWLRTAAGILRPGGTIGIIARPMSLHEILQHMQRRFGSLIIIPVHPRPQEPAIRLVITGIKGSRAALCLAPPLILHNSSGNSFTSRADNINNGRDSLL